LNSSARSPHLLHPNRAAAGGTNACGPDLLYIASSSAGNHDVKPFANLVARLDVQPRITAAVADRAAPQQRPRGSPSDKPVDERIELRRVGHAECLTGFVAVIATPTTGENKLSSLPDHIADQEGPQALPAAAAKRASTPRSPVARIHPLTKAMRTSKQFRWLKWIAVRPVADDSFGNGIDERTRQPVHLRLLGLI